MRPLAVLLALCRTWLQLFFGLAALLHTSALAFHTFKWLGVAYLFYMAWQALKERGALRISTPHPKKERATPQPFIPAQAGIQKQLRADLRVTIEAILINILNPKLSIFFFAFLPQFISGDEPNPLAHMLLLSVAFMALTFIVFLPVMRIIRCTRARSHHFRGRACRHGCDGHSQRRSSRWARGWRCRKDKVRRQICGAGSRLQLRCLKGSLAEHSFYQKAITEIRSVSRQLFSVG